MALAENLRLRLEEMGMTQTELARQVGITQPTIGDLLSGKSQGSKHLHRIARVLQTTPEALTGERVELGSALHDPRLAFSGFPPQIPPEMALVREIDLSLGMGSTYLDVPVSEKFRHFSRDWLRQYTHADPENLLFAQGMGDSMFPTLLDSDLLFIDCSQQNLNVADRIWALAYAECGSVKRLRPVPGGGVLMLSDNPNVPDATAYDGELHILGRVVAVVRKM